MRVRELYYTKSDPSPRQVASSSRRAYRSVRLSPPLTNFRTTVSYVPHHIWGSGGPFHRMSRRRRPVLNRKISLLLLVLCLLGATTAVSAQQGQQPLTNA